MTDSGLARPYTLTTSTVGSGTVAASPSQATYPSGTAVMLTATPAAGFQFSGWSGSATGTTNPLAVTMNANQSLTATFAAMPAAQSVVSYTLVNASTGADIQLLTAGAVLNLATLPSRSLNIRANTNPATVGSVVFNLSGAATQNQTESVAPYALFSDDAAGTYYAWTPPPGSYSLLATPYTGGGGGGSAGAALTLAFSVIDQAAAYTLTTSTVGSGTVAASPSQAAYSSGTVVTLTATPATGYAFSGWSGGATGTANPLTVTMTANKTITATFTAVPAQYSLTVSTVGSGTVTKNPSQASYASGTSVVLTATPAAGYKFSGWSGGATGTTNPLTVTMTANKSLTATFAVAPRVTSFTLVNADTDLDIQALPSGAALNLATLPTRNVAIRANTSPTTVGSVTFVLSGAQAITHTENLVPYSLLADSDGDYPAWTPPVGSYALRATPYAGTDGGGAAGTALSITFTVSSPVVRTAAPTPTAAAPTPTAAAPTLAAEEATLAAEPAAAYPNPSADGRFWLRLPVAWRGVVGYQVLSALGATVAAGELPAAPGTPAVLPLAEVPRGLYLLLLDYHAPGQPRATARLRLLRE